MKNTLTKTIVLCLFAFGASNLKAQTNVPALIQSNQIWNLNGSPYLIGQNTFVDSGVTVTIMPGVEVLALAPNIRFQVDGQLQALGTINSTILIDKLQIEFTKNAVDYDSASGTGTYLNYCEFTSPGIGKRVLYLNNVSAKVENSHFINTYYGIYVQTSGVSNSKVEVLNCVFDDSTGTSFPLYSSGFNSYLVLRGNQFNNVGLGGGMYLYAQTLDVRENKFVGLNRITFYFKGESTISCNNFSHLNSGIEIQVNIDDTTSNCNFTHNTLDSIGNTSFSSPMLKVNKSFKTNLNQSRFNYNNFLTYFGQTGKVQLATSNTSPSSFETYNLRNNYWSSTDSATIEGYINDYADNINQEGRADFSGLLLTKDTTCVDPVPSSCNASYYFALDSNNQSNIFLVNTSTGITNATNFIWFFGDGGRSIDRKPFYSYIMEGNYQIDLRLYNQAENCFSIYSDRITYDSNGFQLKNGGFTIQVIEEWELTSVNHQEFGSVKIYPNPSKGNLMIELAETSNEQGTIELFDLTGKSVLRNHALDAGAKFHNLDLSGLNNGIYMLRLQQGQKVYTTKISVSR